MRRRDYPRPPAGCGTIPEAPRFLVAIRIGPVGWRGQHAAPKGTPMPTPPPGPQRPPVGGNAGEMLRRYAVASAEATGELDLAAGLWETDQPMAAAHAVARAQVHATLAQAAATVLLAEEVAGTDQPTTAATPGRDT